jgi:outer membrane lipoprotein-sorting protein
MTDYWTVEEIFIELMIKSFTKLRDFVTIVNYVSELEKVVNYLSNPSKNAHLISSYNTWVKLRDKYINKFSTKLSTNEHIRFEVNSYKLSRSVNKDEFNALKEKIKNDELSLVKRTYNIAYNEAIHADDELWDGR